tara:strand:- start:567 stop:680 length:114 start_codon:yes stop_codon:yes gene_type:complete
MKGKNAFFPVLLGIVSRVDLPENGFVSPLFKLKKEWI